MWWCFTVMGSLCLTLWLYSLFQDAVAIPDGGLILLDLPVVVVDSSSSTSHSRTMTDAMTSAVLAPVPVSVSAPLNWCDKVAQARSDLLPELRITVPCETMTQATSAVVCFLTAGVADGQGDHKVFSGSDYINGALALGASLQDHLTRQDTHMLLLVREGFTIPPPKVQMLEAVGWTLGKAPIIDVERKYSPQYERYKTLYTKISVIGLSEYNCVLLLDADALTVGNLDDLMSCRILQPNYRVAGTLDYYHGKWYHFNTGSALWNPSSQEMNRVYQLTKDPTFMRRFESDQIFSKFDIPPRKFGSAYTRSSVLLASAPVPCVPMDG